MRQALSLLLVSAIFGQLATAGPDAPDVKAQIVGMPLGVNIELRLKSREKLRGARGAVTDSGFTLLGQSAGDRQIAFDDVASVKLYTHKSHAVVYILAGVGIAAVAVGITVAVLLSHAKY
jgi:hypothetical protein